MNKIKSMIYAHRGLSSKYPENTSLAFQKANDADIRGVEIDVHLTKDGELVVIHDESVNRTSNGTGEVRSLTLKEIKKLDFAAKYKNGKFSSEIILTLEEFLNEFGNKFEEIVIEIKTDKIHYKGIEEKVYNVVQSIETSASIIYCSFNFNTLVKLYELDSNNVLAFLIFDAIQLVPEPIWKKVKEICKFVHPWFGSVLNKYQMELFEKLDKPLNLWTFDGPDATEQWSKGSFNLKESFDNMEIVNGIISNIAI
ncbi:MAG: glycerophosphodiester phosphodiesterase [Mycoplasmataceae bacterium]|nr:glycerophosphodiester phosphodiesterase [Mycoplasmataceae bacterium]